jgi:hypothetical protein
MTARPQWLRSLDLDARRPPEFFYSRDQIDTEAPLHLAGTMRRAWDSLGLCGILCIEGQPAVYYKEADAATSA